MQVKFGKKPVRHDPRTLRMSSYLSAVLPQIPPSYNVIERVLANLPTASPAALFPMDGNDQYACCTFAARAHADTIFGALLSLESVMDQQQVVDLYLKLSGGEDNGLVILDVLKDWCASTSLNDQAKAFVSVDPTNIEHVKLAIYLFGGVYLGFNVQENAVEDFDAGQMWQPGPLTGDGHAVYAVAYDPSSVTVLTWGATAVGSLDWWTECVDEAYAILSPEASSPGFCPTGIDCAQLQADLAAIRA